MQRSSENQGETNYGSTTARVLQYIVDGLNSGRYRPGQRLNAATLCKEMQLSKAPVREALHILAGEGVIEMPKNRGAFIRHLTEQDLLDLWDAMLLPMGRELRLAAMKMTTPGAVDAVMDAMERIKKERKKGASLHFYRSLNHFHDVASKLSDNPFLVPSQLRRMTEFWLPYIMRSIPLERYIDRYVFNYQRVCDALVAGDGRSAESAMTYHSRWSAAIIRGEAPPPHGPWCDEASR